MLIRLTQLCQPVLAHAEPFFRLQEFLDGFITSSRVLVNQPCVVMRPGSFWIHSGIFFGYFKNKS